LRDTIERLLLQEGIDSFGILPSKELKVINERLMPSGIRSAVIMAVPYDTGENYHDGVSAYAHVTDYHLYFKELFDRVIPKLEEAFPGKRFYGFADHSPIHEKEAAAKAGLGMIGKHSLLIHPKYGSYIFLGSVLSDFETDEKASEIRYCENCGCCKASCPAKAISEAGMDPAACFSALSQKKRLTEEELTVLKNAGIAWGCDRCQEACPHNKQRSFSEIPFFLEHRHGRFTAEELERMDEKELLRFAFSWRGKARIQENLWNLENLRE